MKTYPVRGDFINSEDKASSLYNLNYDTDDLCWYQAKLALKNSYQGREICEWVENNLNVKSYLLKQTDVTKLAQSYVNELVQHIDLSNKENKRILNSCDLI